MKSLRHLGFVIPLLSYGSAIAQTHVPESTVNLGDTSFLDRIGAPGMVVEEIGDGTHCSEIVGANGQQVLGTGQVNSISSLTHIAWLSQDRILGAWYGADVVVAAAHVNAGPDSTAAGLGDMQVSPLILQWNEKKLGRVAFDHRVTFDFDLPVGEYSPESNLNLSGHIRSIPTML